MQLEGLVAYEDTGLERVLIRIEDVGTGLSWEADQSWTAVPAEAVHTAARVGLYGWQLEFPALGSGSGHYRIHLDAQSEDPPPFGSPNWEQVTPGGRPWPEGPVRNRIHLQRDLLHDRGRPSLTVDSIGQNVTLPPAAEIDIVGRVTSPSPGPVSVDVSIEDLDDPGLFWDFDRAVWRRGRTSITTQPVDPFAFISSSWTVAFAAVDAVACAPWVT